MNLWGLRKTCCLLEAWNPTLHYIILQIQKLVSLFIVKEISTRKDTHAHTHTHTHTQFPVRPLATVIPGSLFWKIIIPPPCCYRTNRHPQRTSVRVNTVCPCVSNQFVISTWFIAHLITTCVHRAKNKSLSNACFVRLLSFRLLPQHLLEAPAQWAYWAHTQATATSQRPCSFKTHSTLLPHQHSVML